MTNKSSSKNISVLNQQRVKQGLLLLEFTVMPRGLVCFNAVNTYSFCCVGVMFDMCDLSVVGV